MLRVKEKVGILPEVELDNYPSVLSGVARIDVDPSSGTVRVVPTAVESCLGVPLVPSDALPAYRPSEIEYGGKRYVFHEPLECDVRWDDEGGDFLWVEYNALDLFAVGDTVEEAVEEFNYRFASDYERFNYLAGLDNTEGIRLGARLERFRCLMNELVKSVILVININ
jgi:hypothetical protein